MAIRITFHGGAEAVTGSNFLVESGEARVLVDCGMEQGKDYCDACAYEPFPFEPSEIDALVITHAHLDHIGRAPKLVRDGFAGRVYTTSATRDLMAVMLEDSAGLLREEAKREGRPVLYDMDDVAALMARIVTVSYQKPFEVAPGLTAVLRDTGHILGSASVTFVDKEGTKVAFTGDLGNYPSPLLPDPDFVEDADALVMESVYGDRLHADKEGRVARLRDTIKKAAARGGAILIPAFSMERTQLMLYELSNLMEAGDIPEIPVFLDSPLAIKVTEIYEKRAKEYFKEGVQGELAKEGSLFRFPFLTMTPSREESNRIYDRKGPKIIIAGAGMSHGGRIGRHEAHFLPDPTTTLLIVGYQAPGSPGRLLQDGAKTVRINGRTVKVRGKIESFTGWSAHADRDALMGYAERAAKKAKMIFVVLGEPSSARFLAQRIREFIGVKTQVPVKDEVWEVRPGQATKVI